MSMFPSQRYIQDHHIASRSFEKPTKDMSWIYTLIVIHIRDQM